MRGIKILGVHRYRRGIAAVGGLCGVRGGQAVVERFAENVAGDPGSNAGRWITERFRQVVPRCRHQRIDGAQTFGPFDLRERQTELGREPVSHRGQLVQCLCICGKEALQCRRGSGRLDMLAQCLRGDRRDTCPVQQFSHRVDRTVALECGEVTRQGRGGDSEQPGQARCPVRRQIRAGEVGLTGVEPGVGFGQGDGKVVRGVCVVPDELRGGMP
ncbi:hypothetical protein [Nocardia sp. AB354]|uniref:hypothetical protein n=1 Tax=Nocardia sp. AB354 TaxID=3413283 RepID=UPI003C19CC06